MDAITLIIVSVVAYIYIVCWKLKNVMDYTFKNFAVSVYKNN